MDLTPNSDSDLPLQHSPPTQSPPANRRQSFGRGRGRAKSSGLQSKEVGALGQADLQPQKTRGELAEHVELDPGSNDVLNGEEHKQDMVDNEVESSLHKTASVMSIGRGRGRGLNQGQRSDYESLRHKLPEVGGIVSSTSSTTLNVSGARDNDLLITDTSKFQDLSMPPLEEFKPSSQETLSLPSSKGLPAMGQSTKETEQFSMHTVSVGSSHNDDSVTKDNVLILSSLPAQVSCDQVEAYCEGLGHDFEVKSVNMLGGGKARVEIHGLSFEELAKIKEKTHKMKRQEFFVEILPTADLSIEDAIQSDTLASGSDNSDSSECTIEVRNLPPNVEPDMLEMYFESAKSGGCSAAVKAVELINPSVAHVTFHKPEVATRVLKRDKHDLLKTSLQLRFVSKSMEEEHEKDKFFLQNIPNGIDKEYLAMFLERQLQLNENEFSTTIYGDVAVINFTREFTVQDLQGMISKIQSKPVKGATLQVELYKVCDSIRLSNVTVGNHYTEDYIELYFGSNKSGGDLKKVKSVELLGNGEAVVIFEDPKDVSRVLKSPHKNTFGPGVKIELNDQLYIYKKQQESDPNTPPETISGSPSSSTEPKAAASLELKLTLKPIVASSLKRDSGNLKKQLENFCVELDIDSKNGLVSVKPTKFTPFGWQSECQKELDAYVKDHHAVLENIALPKEGLQDAITYLSNLQSELPSFTFELTGDNSMSVVGSQESVSYIQDKLEEISEQYTVKTVAVPLEEQDYSFFTHLKLPQHKDLFPSVKVTSDSKNHTLQIVGSMKTIREFENMIPELCVHNAVPLQVDQRVIRYFQNKGYQKLLAFIQKESCPIVPFFVPGKQEMVFLCEQKQNQTKLAEKAGANLKKATVVRHKDIPTSFQSLMPQLDDFNQLCQELESQNTVEIEIDNNNINIVGFVQGVQQCERHLMHYIKEKCTIEVSIGIEWGIWRLFDTHMGTHWQSIVGKCKKLEIQVQEPSDANNSQLMLKGDQSHVENVCQEIANLQSRVCCKNLERDQPGTCEFFRSDKARLYLDGIEKQKVTIEITEADEEEVSSEVTMSSPPSNFKRKCTAQLPNSNKQITVIVGDITEFDKADVIVNAANEELKHIGGVAKAIADKGGPVIQDDSTKHVKKRGKIDTGEVWMTERVGNLPCKALVHAVGPRWAGGFRKEEALLEKACFRSLSKVEKKYHSISFPAIGSGVYAVPIDTCATSMIKAFIEYDKKHPAVEMREIYIVLFKETDTSPFISALQKALPPDRVHIDQAPPTVSHYPQPQLVSATRHSGGQQSPVSQARRRKGNPVASSSIAGRVKLYKGGLLDVKADAYVNSTNTNLDLSQGAVSQALLKAGGQSLQSECTQNAPVGVGDVVVTGSGNLPCRRVLHTVIPGYQSGGQAEMILRKSVRTCLEKCSELKMTSVAFPSIGTGNLHFPSHIVAKIMVDEVHSYLSSHKSTSIAVIHLVIFMNETYLAFQQEIQKLTTEISPEPELGSPVMTKAMPARQPRRVRSHKSDNPIRTSKAVASGGGNTFAIGQLSVSIVQGDIGDESSDAIVVPTNTTLQLAGQGVAGAILKKGGQELQALCDTVIANGMKPSEGKVITTPVTGDLKSKSLFYIVFAGKDDKKFVRVVTACLQKAEEKKFRSISFPAIDTCLHGYSATGMLKAIEQFSQKLRHLQSVRIVLFKPEIFGVFLSVFQNPQAASAPGLIERAKNFISYLSWSTDSPQKDDSLSYGSEEDFDENLYREVVIRIYGVSQQAVDDAADKVDQLIDETLTRDQVENDYIDQLSPEHDSTLLKEAKNLKVHLKIDRDPLNTIRLKGSQTSVHKMKCFVTELLSDVERAIKQKKEAEQLYKTVVWVRTGSNNDEEEYPIEENYKIETAYQDKNATGKVQCGGPFDVEYFTIDFDKQQEVDHKEKGAVSKVKRVDLLKKLQEGEKPSHWDTMPIDPSTEKEARLHVVDLSTSNKEYTDVKNLFDKTMQQTGSSATAQHQSSNTAAVPVATPTGAVSSLHNSSSQYNSIVKIQRIQNPALYFQYLTRKKEMDKLNPQGHKNERQLFHGTKTDTCSQINHGGFNRSYCGQNATIYGKGVYFARDAEYSARGKYSSPDGKGYKYVYLARVLTGEYTRGSGGMLVPPAKDPLNQYILFDSVVDNVQTPGIFVVFHDAQNYPEYLITFF